MPISQMLLPEFDHEMANTRSVLERFPEGKNGYKPHEKSMELGRLAGHVAQLPEWATMTLTTEALNMEPGTFQPFIPSSRQELLETFDRNVSAARTQIAAASDDSFGTVWTVSMSGNPIMSMPRVMVIRGMVLNHLIHHRAQLGVYLRLNEIPLPALYGPTADEGAWGGQTQTQAR